MCFIFFILKQQKLEIYSVTQASQRAKVFWGSVIHTIVLVFACDCSQFYALEFKGLLNSKESGRRSAWKTAKPMRYPLLSSVEAGPPLAHHLLVMGNHRASGHLQSPAPSRTAGKLEFPPRGLCAGSSLGLGLPSLSSIFAGWSLLIIPVPDSASFPDGPC